MEIRPTTEMNRRNLLRLGLAIGVTATVGGALVGCGEHDTNQNTPNTARSSEQPSLTPTSSSTPEIKKPAGEFSPVSTWSQDFSKMPNGVVDSNVWAYELDPAVPGYNNEAQIYTNSLRNVRVDNGVLIIEAHREPHKITSGRIDTRDSFSFEYGKLEATMKLPKGDGTWPAFWLLSANQPHTTKLHPVDDDWDKPNFYLHDGELDIMESYGNNPGVIEATMHSYKHPNIAQQLSVPDASEVFHTYGIEVTPTKITWTLDGKPYQTLRKTSNDTDYWPFGNGNRLYAILNLAMGGTGGGTIDPHQNNWRMDVKSVDFYKYIK